MLLPMIFPIAISAFPFLAADNEVNNSGSDVPSAIIVRPMNLSLTPKSFASCTAASTVILLPSITKNNPASVAMSAFPIEKCLTSCATSSAAVSSDAAGESSQDAPSKALPPFFAPHSRYPIYPQNTTMKIMPSNSPISPSIPSSNNRTVTTIQTGRSINIADFDAAIGVITDHNLPSRSQTNSSLTHTMLTLQA
mgnify:CR=1 FL=1